MDILKIFIFNETKHFINILWEEEKPLFRAKEIANILEMKDINSIIRDYSIKYKVMRETHTPGGLQKVIFLTEHGMYKLLMRSNKPNAELFQEWITDIIVSIREKGKYELKIKLDEIEKNNEEKIKMALEEEANKYKKDLEKITHNTLISAFENKYVVYIGKININPIYNSSENSKFLIKIGSTKQIQIRAQSLNKQFSNNNNSFSLIKVYEVPMNEMFEKFLHHHKNIVKYKYTEKIYQNYQSNSEIFLVNNDELQKIIRIADHNKFKFVSKIDSEDIKLKQIQCIKNINDNLIKETTESIKETSEPIILQYNERKHTQVRGDKIQIYSSDGCVLIKTYESYAFAIRDKNLNNPTRSGIKCAIKNNSIYKNHRWINLKRDLPDNTIQQLERTTSLKEVNIGFVAMLNLDKNNIIKVFCDQKEATKDRKFNSSSSISNAIKRNSISSGHYFIMWNDCSDELKRNYLKYNKLPEKRINNNTIQLNQIHPINKNILKTYTCIEDIVKEFKISRKTLKNACEYDLLIGGFNWKYNT